MKAYECNACTDTDDDLNLLKSKLPPVKRVALFLRPKAVKQRKHESANVSFCDPVQSTGFPKQTMNAVELITFELDYKKLV